VYTIGQFSKIGKVSTKALRYYDEIDLLKPMHVDHENQYRYYSDEQVLKILLISKLKEYGLHLEKIKVVLDRQNVNLLKEFLKNKGAFSVVSRRTTTSIENIGNIIGKVFEDIYQMNLQPSGPVIPLLKIPVLKTV